MNPQELPAVEAGQHPARVLIPQVQVQQLSPAALAYLGDAVYELYVRTYCLLPPSRLQSYHRRVVSHVRAETQANYLRSLQPHLSAAESEILRQGRNAVSGRPKRLDPATYQQATSFETLIGYLYLTNPQRLDEILQFLNLDPVKSDSGIL